MAQRDPGHWVLGGQGSMAMSPPCQRCSACSPIPVLPRRGGGGTDSGQVAGDGDLRPRVSVQGRGGEPSLEAAWIFGALPFPSPLRLPHSGLM